jgi:hypothetical protein
MARAFERPHGKTVLPDSPLKGMWKRTIDALAGVDDPLKALESGGAGGDSSARSRYGK